MDNLTTSSEEKNVCITGHSEGAQVNNPNVTIMFSKNENINLTKRITTELLMKQANERE